MLAVDVWVVVEVASVLLVIIYRNTITEVQSLEEE